MSTAKVARDPSLRVGSSTDVNIASAPPTLTFETEFSLVPSSFTPSSGLTTRCDIYNTASQRGLFTNLDLVMDLKHTGTPAESILLSTVAKLIDWLKVYVNNVQIMWMDSHDACWLNMMRNMMLSTNSYGEYKNLWEDYGCDKNEFNNGYRAPFNVQLGPNDTGRVTIPMDLLVSHLFHRWDSARTDKISFEMKWRTTTTAKESGQFIIAGGGTADVYPALMVMNSFIQPRIQLYADEKIFKPLSQPYYKPMLKLERQAVKLSKEIHEADTNSPANVRVRLSDTFAKRQRILGLCLTLDPKYTSYGTASGSICSQCWQPNSCGAVVYKGGKILEDLSNPHKFSRASDQFLKCMGATWAPFYMASPTVNPTALSEELVFFNGNIGNFISFINPQLQESHTKGDWLDKIQLLQGISNQTSETYEVDINIWESVPVKNLASLVEFSDKLIIHMLYLELLCIDSSANVSSNDRIKIFS